MIVTSGHKMVIYILVGSNHALVIEALQWADDYGIRIVRIAYKNILHVANGSYRKTARKICVHCAIDCMGKCRKK